MFHFTHFCHEVSQSQQSFGSITPGNHHLCPCVTQPDDFQYFFIGEQTKIHSYSQFVQDDQVPFTRSQYCRTFPESFLDKAYVFVFGPVIKETSSSKLPDRQPPGETAINTTAGSNVKIGAENVHFEKSGAFTGEISADMLVELGVEYVVIGHSERRQYFGETDETVNKRTKAALAAGLKPIV